MAACCIKTFSGICWEAQTFFPYVLKVLHITTLTPEATAWLTEALGDDAIHASRLPEGNGKGKKGGSKSKNRSIKYVCPECGTSIRATREVNVICGDCEVPFERE